jgi:glyoxylase-like metal-dependent hydrolase (beta-lactamase superfamily II)
MKVHHLNCATLCPALGKLLVNRDGFMLCHCLLVETSEGLVLVDSGLGTVDLADPRRVLGGWFVAIARPRLDPAELAVRQVERLGFKAADVRHIVMTHLDLDHAGGLRDFPDATVHVHRPELDAARARATYHERSRYRPRQLEGVRFATHEADGQGEDWFGLRAVKPLPGLDIALVPLLGHTRGHCGVAVRGGSGWLLHCGDAYFHADQMDPARERCSAGLWSFQRLVAMDNAARQANIHRIRELARERRSEIRVFSAHDPSEFRALSQAEPSRIFA